MKKEKKVLTEEEVNEMSELYYQKIAEVIELLSFISGKSEQSHLKDDTTRKDELFYTFTRKNVASKRRLRKELKKSFSLLKELWRDLVSVEIV